MKFLLSLILLFSTGVAAQGTDNYYDFTRSGEGITYFEYINHLGEPSILFYLYTYGREECEILVASPTVVEECVDVTATATAECPNSIFPPHNPLCDPVEVEVTETQCATASAPNFYKSCNMDGQRWFMMFAPTLAIGSGALGPVFITQGVNYPEGISSTEPFVTDVGEALRVGTFLLKPLNSVFGDGYQLWVEPLNPAVEYDEPTLELDPDDPLFDQIWLMDTPMMLNVIGSGK